MIMLILLFKINKTIVYDLGTYKYELEPKYCRREYHNMPFLKKHLESNIKAGS